MAAAKDNVKRILRDAGVMEARGTSDTIKLWENHRDQATLWRAISLLQIPVTLLALILGIYLHFTRQTVLNVPPKPLPGTYIAQDIADTEFIEFATSYVNHVATFQYATARRQFIEARRMLWDKMISLFDEQFINNELQKIETTSRTQMFLIDPTKTQINRRGPHEVDVIFVGDRTRVIAGKELPTEHSKYTITMTTIPKNNFNHYGIVIINAILKNINPRTGAEE